MKRHLLAATAACMLTAPAQADPPQTWTGFYLGASGGQVTAKERGDLAYNDPAFPAYTAADVFDPVARSNSLKGWMAGGTVGYNHQIGIVVVGAEADMSWVGADGDFSATSKDTFTTWNMSSRLYSLGTARGRIGLAAGPVLFYATGGGAWALVETSNAVSCVGCPVTPWAEGTSKASHLGWVGGGGIEWAVGGGFSIKAEYLAAGLGSKPHNFVGTALSGTTLKDPNVPGVYDYRSDSYNHDLSFQMIRAGLNFKFN